MQSLVYKHAFDKYVITNVVMIGTHIRSVETNIHPMCQLVSSKYKPEK